MMVRNNIAVLINTHERAREQHTYKALRDGGYTGRVYFVVDDEDGQLSDYKELYGDENVLVFNKREYLCDTFVNTEIWRSVLYARNASYTFARVLGLDYFVLCDDDLTHLFYKLPKNGKLISKQVTNFDEFLCTVTEVLRDAHMPYIGMVESGAYFGGANDNVMGGFTWRSGHFWLIDAKYERRFRGVMYEDRIFSDDSRTDRGYGCFLWCCETPAFKNSNQTGGMQSTYNDFGGTYVAAFFPVMAHPSYESIVLDQNGFSERRSATNADPKIISERWKK